MKREGVAEQWPEERDLSSVQREDLGALMESRDGDIATFPSCLGPEVKVKVKEKQNRVAFSELR